ncbi:hypothetical protein COU78_02710 [Candidatus Peregrinibacteria bacterium CG10_big_fil_rev_8_21_14_0_10_49_24]|nr:MAG: hypothetical protein COV83_02690 [Candidatus Peregrinibacteria bacterium CG11_big_fil_rev_8_21_14_0_20_49_14]PIR51048.1 MAG: hypothetical protein COU78_02710 [Candidatus Peregrinibacteria bacterium CG10_big_fil_rev_8_21_14_0_10_49_24]PJA67601.1 MAG: hypothetical protein CO157_04190 [Candidatus Peregrinibacteria bacterium CG_4_9_14_3_um_filter_49_12]
MAGSSDFQYSSVRMPYQNLEPVSKQLTIIVGLAVVGFMSFGLALSFYRNALFEETLKNINKQNNSLREKITHDYQNLEYYRSTQYKDKYAKENLGLVNPGEKVLIITQDTNVASFPLDASATTADQQEAAYLELLRQMPVAEHWKLFFFHREKIDELKRAL